ncbi:PIG-L deacetylase family protein [Limnochorda pilosa]|uniref:GlcNAc-PI de-N-acetylase n=1 Tax=Limnochorda pilosa TaxID=1555112 RepID=A0A0K2SM68_LIMPI|nr:PIG-L deacetylase family protein [Limnochorda pilosa]BAS28200.1 GlcNAc-PI de-N-acetylase [Limnochorda pilosa]
MSEPLKNQKSILVVGAHAADFVWRAAGAVAVATSLGARATVVALSYGERGEAGDLWKEPNQTLENVRRIRREQAEQAAAAIGAEFRCLDLGDYPLEVDREALDRLTELIHEVAPDVILTHTEKDPFNPDHPVACEAVKKARLLAAGSGVVSAFKTLKPPALYCFEPHQPELCGFVPTTFVDITPVFEKKRKAMEAVASQTYLQRYYAELAERRGNHARRASGDSSIKHAEAYQRLLPMVVSEL